MYIDLFHRICAIVSCVLSLGLMIFNNIWKKDAFDHTGEDTIYLEKNEVIKQRRIREANRKHIGERIYIAIIVIWFICTLLSLYTFLGINFDD